MYAGGGAAAGGYGGDGWCGPTCLRLLLAWLLHELPVLPTACEQRPTLTRLPYRNNGTWFDTHATYMPHAAYGMGGPLLHGARGGAEAAGAAGVTLCVLRLPWAPAGEDFIRVRHSRTPHLHKFRHQHICAAVFLAASSHLGGSPQGEKSNFNHYLIAGYHLGGRRLLPRSRRRAADAALHRLIGGPLPGGHGRRRRRRRGGGVPTRGVG